MSFKSAAFFLFAQYYRLIFLLSCFRPAFHLSPYKPLLSCQISLPVAPGHCFLYDKDQKGEKGERKCLALLRIIFLQCKRTSPTGQQWRAPFYNNTLNYIHTHSFLPFLPLVPSFLLSLHHFDKLSSNNNQNKTLTVLIICHSVVSTIYYYFVLDSYVHTLSCVRDTAFEIGTYGETSQQRRGEDFTLVIHAAAGVTLYFST